MLSPGYNPNDYLTSGGFNQLTQGLGLRGTGGGWNPAMPLQRRGTVGLGMRGLQQLAFGNEMEPLRQNALRSFIMQLNPANIQARLDAVSRANRSRAAESYQHQASMAPMFGINPASLASFYAQADRDTAGEGQRMRSPGGMSDAYGALMNAFSMAQDPSALMQLAQLTGATQQENQSSGQNVPSQGGGLGGLLGGLGQMFGMGGFGNLFSRGGGSPTGGGTVGNPWAYWSQHGRNP